MWKIFDNLRRSLVSPALLALLVGGWLFAQGTEWSPILLVTAVVFLPPLLATMIELIRKPEDRDLQVHLTQAAKAAGRPMTLALLTLILLPYDTLICLHAILRSGVRMLFTRRGLMLWQLPSYAIRNARRTAAEFFQEMWIAPLLAVILVLPLGHTRAVTLLLPAPILLLWLVSPMVAWWISRPLSSPASNLSGAQRAFLRTSARRTWRFFAEFVGPQDNWLPPDNFQEYPVPVIASRTSPTNMGMALLANMAACDFGYISIGEFLRRTENTLATMEKLERYHGHFYNWYDTRTLQPLAPRYVSSVDSGNLAGSLLTLQAGLAELKGQPVLSANAVQGLQDTLQVLSDVAPSPPPELAAKIRLLQETLDALSTNGLPQTLAAAGILLDEMHPPGGELAARLPPDVDPNGELHSWAQAFDRQFRALLDDLKFLVPEPGSFANIPTLRELAEERAAGTETVSSAGAAAAGSGYKGAMGRLREISDLEDRCRELAVMDFKFLYDTERGLLAIGYDVGERRRDPSCYDLLASEARLASFLLIAQGQVPQKHWFLLGRLLTSHGSDVSLISWSGSMFEYLMPQLIMPTYENTLLDQTCKAAVSRQIEYGRQRAVPWGISESCYNATDMHQVYQYRAFGVPGLGLKRGLGRRPGHRPLCHRPGAHGNASGSVSKPAAACRPRLHRCLWLLRSDRLHAITGSAGEKLCHRAHFHGASSGDEPAGLCPCLAQPADATPIHGRPSRPGDGIVAAGTGAEERRHPAPACGGSERCRPPSR